MINVLVPQPYASQLAAGEWTAINSAAKPPREVVGQRVNVVAAGCDVEAVQEALNAGVGLPRAKRPGGGNVYVYSYDRKAPRGRWVADGAHVQRWVPNPKYGIGELCELDLKLSGGVCSVLVSGFLKLDQGKVVAQYRPGNDRAFQRPKGPLHGPIVWVVSKPMRALAPASRDVSTEPTYAL